MDSRIEELIKHYHHLADVLMEQSIRDKRQSDKWRKAANKLEVDRNERKH